MKLVYIAGPYSGDSTHMTMLNCRYADDHGARVFRACQQKVYPVIPHNNTPPHWEGLAPYDTWLRATLALLMRCDAVYLVPGWENSRGSQAEKTQAEASGIPVFTEIDAVAAWVAVCGYP